MERHHKKKHCEIDFSDKKPKKQCKKEKKCDKKCKSSSSSSECEKICVPKVVYQACICGGVASLSLSAVVTTPNNDQPPTFTCPAQIGQRIYINFTVTNTGNVKIKSPIYIFSSFSGVHKVTCKTLHPGESKSITVHNKISNCQCQPGNNISISSNAYTNIHNNCLILVSPALGTQINQA